MEKSIKIDSLNEMKKDYLNEKGNTVIRHSLSKTKLDDMVYSSDISDASNFTFSTDIKTMPVTNQKQSGRCWIFSASNLLREAIANKLHIEKMFEISQNYIAFYDKLEKINFVLESIISKHGEKPDEREFMFILQNAVSDGGQWDMFVNIVKKYGIVPKANMVETCQSSFTMQMNKLINCSLRRFAYEASKLKTEEEIYQLKDEYVKKFYSLLCSCFGVPPTKFDFEYYDDKHNYHIEKDITPKQFYDEYISSFIDNYVSIIHAPTSDKKYLSTYTVKYLGNVIEGKKVTHLNLPLNRMKELIINQLKDNNLVWFGSDVSFYGVREEGMGMWNDQSFDYKTPFGLDLSFDKAGMLDYHASCMNHAMVLTGVNIKDGKPDKWKVENSWGSKIGTEGYFIMSDTFFDKFVYQAAILKKYLSKEELDALTKEPILLPCYDPFGTLAD